MTIQSITSNNHPVPPLWSSSKLLGSWFWSQNHSESLPSGLHHAALVVYFRNIPWILGSLQTSIDLAEEFFSICGFTFLNGWLWDVIYIPSKYRLYFISVEFSRNSLQNMGRTLHLILQFVHSNFQTDGQVTIKTVMTSRVIPPEKKTSKNHLKLHHDSTKAY